MNLLQHQTNIIDSYYQTHKPIDSKNAYDVHFALCFFGGFVESAIKVKHGPFLRQTGGKNKTKS